MITRTAFLTVIAILAITPGFAGSGSQHSAQSLHHSGQAASHGSAAIASAASVIVSAPIIAFGSAVTISGIALEEIGAGALTLGSDIARAGQGHHTARPAVMPNGAPTLD